MIRRPPRSTRTDTLFPYTTLFRLAARENKANIINGVDLGAHSGDVSAILLDLTQRETMNLASDFARLLQREASDEVEFRTTAHRFASFIVLRSEEHTSELQSLMRISYAVFCLKTKNQYN